ncbi:palmitoyltransferase akr1 [Rhodosporidiobolus nylandii]
MAAPIALSTKSTATTSLSSPSPSSPSSSSSLGSSSAPPPEPVAVSPPPLPELPPLHLAAQRGDLPALATLLSPRPPQQPADVNGRDQQGITALHWAAINGHVAFCKELLRNGAQVDVRGGELEGTALHWAARNGHLPIVHLLLSHSADPTLSDSQSFNCLHLTVHSSSAFLLAYLVHTLQPISIDTPDAEGHTALAWAAYQGDAISVELLLGAGADANREDNAGLRPLHWAVTKGNSQCIRRLVEAGAELNAREGQGKTAREMAIELKSLAAYDRGLAEAGIDPYTGLPFDVPLSPSRTRIAIFAVVFLALGLAFATLAHLPWYASFLLVPAEAYGMHHIVARVLLGIKGGGTGHGRGHGGGGGERLTKSPYLCAIIAASLGWVGHPVDISLNLSLRGLLRDMLRLVLQSLYDGPWDGAAGGRRGGGVERVGLRPRLAHGGQWSYGAERWAREKATIESLVLANQFNGMSFCLTCLVRRPLRSKHSYATGRCVARFDHYCPWVWNDVGVNNHRQFLLFVGSLVLGVVSFISLTWSYFYERAPSLPPDYVCPAIAPSFLCVATSFDPFALAVCIWAFLQLTWTAILFSVQIFQVARQMTTLEVSNVSRYGFLGGRAGVSGSTQQGYQEKWSAAQAARHAANLGGGAGDAGESSAADPASLAHAPSTSRPSTPSGGGGLRATGQLAFLLKLLGLDRFTRRGGGALHSLSASAHGEVANPFDIGVLGNCRDFWTRGGELGVSYERLYDIPQGGYKAVVAARKRREREGVGMDARGGYERVAMEDVV